MGLAYTLLHIQDKLGHDKTPEDGEMKQMNLSSRHRIQNARPGGLRLNTHYY